VDEAVGVGPADGVGVGDALELADGDAVGLADPEGVPVGELEALVVGASATGLGELLGRAAKNRGGRLKVGTSNQKGARGSSEK
jgi:hypothetical protein